MGSDEITLNRALRARSAASAGLAQHSQPWASARPRRPIRPGRAGARLKSLFLAGNGSRAVRGSGRVELLERDDADPRQHAGEAAHVVLEVEHRSPGDVSSAKREFTNSRNPRSPTAAVASSDVICGRKSPSWLASRTSPGRSDERLERALDADVDGLLAGAAGQRDRAVVQREQRGDERHRQLAVRGVEEEQRHDGLLPDARGELAHPVPARALLRAAGGGRGRTGRGWRRCSRRRRAGRSCRVTGLGHAVRHASEPRARRVRLGAQAPRARHTAGPATPLAFQPRDRFRAETLALVMSPNHTGAVLLLHPQRRLQRLPPRRPCCPCAASCAPELRDARTGSGTVMHLTDPDDVALQAARRLDPGDCRAPLRCNPRSASRPCARCSRSRPGTTVPRPAGSAAGGRWARPGRAGPSRWPGSWWR